MLVSAAMATPKLVAPDLVTLANLHAALDSMLEVEALIDGMKLPPAGVPAKPRLAAHANEMRTLLTQLLSPAR